jgi:ribosomal protein S18 acetylase RimI-like enzyme
MIKFRHATNEDVSALGQLAEKAWLATYPGIISAAQINYMLSKMYNPATIDKQITEGTIKWLIGEDNNRWVGYASFGPHPSDKEAYRLHKLYLDPELKGKGYGKAFLDEVVSRLPEGIQKLELNVNKLNPALAFYKKMNFTVLREEVIDIGEGHLMDDFVLVLAV